MLCRIRMQYQGSINRTNSSTDPIQETLVCAKSCRLCRSHPATWAISYRSYRSYRSMIYLPCLGDLDREVHSLSVVTYPMCEIRMFRRIPCVWVDSCWNDDRTAFIVASWLPKRDSSINSRELLLFSRGKLQSVFTSLSSIPAALVRVLYTLTGVQVPSALNILDDMHTGMSCS